MSTLEEVSFGCFSRFGASQPSKNRSGRLVQVGHDGNPSIGKEESLGKVKDSRDVIPTLLVAIAINRGYQEVS